MSDDNDPFAAFGNDRTVIKPSAGRGAAPGGPALAGMATPGGAGAAALPPGAGVGNAPAGKEAPLSLDAMMSANLNPLVAAAMPLLVAGPRVRHTARHPNPAALRDALADGVRKFEAQARTQGLPNEQVVAGRYILCTYLDECAASTPWGAAANWSAQSLLVQFHNETWGGEKIFALLSKLAENVAGNRSLLELLYVVLSFGFEGRYRIIDNGRAQLDGVVQRLGQMLRQGQNPEKALSPRWQGHPDSGEQLDNGLPLWVIAAITALALALVFMGLRFSLGNKADPLFEQLQVLDAKAAVVAGASPPPPPPAAPKARLAGLLKPEIDAGLVQVQDLADRSIVTIRGDGFFEPGSAEIASGVRSLLPRIAAALASLPGPVTIVGHTDNVPIRTLRFPSNWHLSQARADAVRDELQRSLPAQRLKAEGKADAEGLVDNSSPANRARNRRVDITLFVQQAPA